MNRLTHVFSTGAVIEYTPTNPRTILLFEQARAKKKPPVPVETIETPGPLQGTTQPNEADPDYQAALLAWAEESDGLRGKFYLEMAELTPQDTDWQERVTSWRELALRNGIELTEENDIILWVTDIASGHPEETNEFLVKVMSAYVPSGDRRAQIRGDLFRGDTQGDQVVRPKGEKVGV